MAAFAAERKLVGTPRTSATICGKAFCTRTSATNTAALFMVTDKTPSKDVITSTVVVNVVVVVVVEVTVVVVVVVDVEVIVLVVFEVVV